MESYKIILLDANYIVSFLVNTEKNYKRALEISKSIQEKEIVITNAILIETINLLTKKLNKNTKAISKAYELINHNFKIVYVNEELIEQAMKTLVQYKANIGLADSLNIEVMKDMNIYEIASFDPDFDNKEGIVRIH